MASVSMPPQENDAEIEDSASQEVTLEQSTVISGKEQTNQQLAALASEDNFEEEVIEEEVVFEEMTEDEVQEFEDDETEDDEASQTHSHADKSTGTASKVTLSSLKKQMEESYDEQDESGPFTVEPNAERRKKKKKSHKKRHSSKEGGERRSKTGKKRKKSSKHKDGEMEKSGHKKKGSKRKSHRASSSEKDHNHPKYYKAIEEIEKGVEVPRNQDTDIELGVESPAPPVLAKNVSTLAANDDPFAYREGKTLIWREVNMVLKGKGDENDRMLLDNVWGEVPERQTTAIMGPSGAGKTSLLNILAGRASSRGRVTITSDVRLNNFAVDPTDINVRKHIAFVAQDDSLQVTSTPREAIYFSAKLRLPRSTPEKNLQKLVEKMLEELGLTHCADTFVGGALVKGISGGERKRTSVGVELVVKPAMVFLDEPTSGLDSFSAVQLCQVLKKVANAGSSVLFTIHQPASEIFNSFDRLILLNKGRVMFQGAVKDVPRYFKSRGHPNPPNYNPADWIMNVAQSIPLEALDRAGFFPQDERNLPDPFTSNVEGKDELGITLTEHHLQKDFDGSTVGLSTQTRMLFSRELKNFGRDTVAIGARFGLTIFLGVLVGLIFSGAADGDASKPTNLNSHFGALIMVLMMSMFGTAQPALLAFPEERPVFLREYSTNHYSVLSYFLSRLTMEAVVTAVQVLVQNIITYYFIGFQASFAMIYGIIYALAMSSTALAVMLGCSVEDPKLGQEMLPILFVPQMLFSGFFVTPSLIPVWLRWARFACSLTYAIRLALVAEFGHGCGSEQADKQCEGLLEAIEADEDELWWYWCILGCLFLFFRLMGLFILQRKAVKFF